MSRPERERALHGAEPRRTSLFADGTPMVWLSGGALVAALASVLGLVGLVAWLGVGAFWPGPPANDEAEWTLVIELQDRGRLRAVAQRFEFGGQVVATGPDEVWRLFELHHEPSRKRFERRRALERRAAAGEDQDRIAEPELERLRAEIDSLRAANRTYRLVVAAADGSEHALQVSDIVRAYPANRLTWRGRLGVFASRTVEFLWGEPRAGGTEGGVFAALLGTVALTLLMCVAVVPFGVLAALYLAEYARPGPLVGLLRLGVHGLAGVPGIVFGALGLGLFCHVIGARVDRLLFASELPEATFGGGGLLWAALTLALMTLPVVIVPTEEALAAVPGSVREGSYACGATRWQTVRRIVLPRALPGISTGVILAISRAVGTVAPLMLVGAARLGPELDVYELAVNDRAPYLHPSRGFLHLGHCLYDLSGSGAAEAPASPLLFPTALLLLSVVVALNALAVCVRVRWRTRVREHGL